MNTKFSYMYRDAGNWKSFYSVVFEGEISDAQLKHFAEITEGNEYFIPRAIGLSGGVLADEDGYVPDFDHYWCEHDFSDSFETVNEKPDVFWVDGKPVTVTINDFLNVFEYCNGRWESSLDNPISLSDKETVEQIALSNDNADTISESLLLNNVDEILKRTNTKPPVGRDSVFGSECGILLPPEDEEFDYYAINNPSLPFGFYDENQSLFFKDQLSNELNYLRQYIENGVEGTYGIISFQGFVDIDSSEYAGLKNGDYDIDYFSYTFFKNSNEIVWSGCKKDGKFVEGFLEKELAASPKSLTEHIKSAEAVAVNSESTQKRGEIEPVM